MLIFYGILPKVVLLPTSAGELQCSSNGKTSGTRVEFAGAFRIEYIIIMTNVRYIFSTQYCLFMYYFIETHTT